MSWDGNERRSSPHRRGEDHEVHEHREIVVQGINGKTMIPLGLILGVLYLAGPIGWNIMSDHVQERAGDAAAKAVAESERKANAASIQDNRRRIEASEQRFHKLEILLGRIAEKLGVEDMSTEPRSDAGGALEAERWRTLNLDSTTTLTRHFPDCLEKPLRTGRTRMIRTRTWTMSRRSSNADLWRLARSTGVERSAGTWKSHWPAPRSRLSS